MNNCDEQKRHLDHVKNHIHELAGKNLGCWCPVDAPCHGNVLLLLANNDGKLTVDHAIMEQIMTGRGICGG